MRWYINLIALCVALATASPTPGYIVESRNNDEAMSAYDKRGGCSDGDSVKGQECCCECGLAGAWPCIGCSGVSNVTKQILPLMWADDGHNYSCFLAPPTIPRSMYSVHSTLMALARCVPCKDVLKLFPLEMSRNFHDPYSRI
jgi:hypothetical protein